MSKFISALAPCLDTRQLTIWSGLKNRNNVWLQNSCTLLVTETLNNPKETYQSNALPGQLQVEKSVVLRGQTSSLALGVIVSAQPKISRGGLTTPDQQRQGNGLHLLNCKVVSSAASSYELVAPVQVSASLSVNWMTKISQVISALSKDICSGPVRILYLKSGPVHVVWSKKYTQPYLQQFTKFVKVFHYTVPYVCSSHATMDLMLMAVDQMNRSTVAHVSQSLLLYNPVIHCNV